MKLSNRIRHIINMCEYNKTIIDVGCDHGYISIGLLNFNKCLKCYAVDINREPLNIAMKNIKKYSLDSKVECILSDGFRWFDNLENLSAIIAGMGGTTIASIIDRDLDKIRHMNYILIQPNAYSKDIRKYLYEKQFHVEKEDVIYSKGIYYEYILIFPKQQENLNKEYINFLMCFDYDIPLCVFDNIGGKYNDFIKHKINKYNNILINLNESKLSTKYKYEIFSNRIKILKGVLV
ncbi:tRNA (adenine(22)-N(1))-methyltransferase [Candidatus Arthromitus sp. SFB-rat-Yit]|uniref:tRNA (adenine(22)-N(1))-methyltransferase n=1 Tax=Candidatus Arthromitus sp. SFB-rat-Yit TaxID=1041504 RepID=UPI000227A559|nr:class I SAM-dependent methyltransferase [Candidatus Arthromitus sp. SFB-rat-Yit]BAK81005.1 putative SAM-dependent methyltransferase [Candidatus Arthromitus sp. SFB-rat-Yit]